MPSIVSLQNSLHGIIEELIKKGLTETEIRRLIESELNEARR